MTKAIQPKTAETGAVDAFLDRAALAATDEAVAGRLIFALDATMSRQPTWDLALSLQSRMFEAAAGFGGLAVQLVYYRGLRECRASRWILQGAGLAAAMRRITVEGGETQIAKVLAHARDEATARKVRALVFVGDAMEENVDRLSQLAGELALVGVKAFMFHEGGDARAGQAFREVARLTGGAYAAFDASAPARLADLLAAAAAYAVGGRRALEDAARRSRDAQALLTQMR